VLVKEQLAAELDDFARFVALDHLGVRLEQAEELLLGGDRLAVQDAALRLTDGLPDQGEEVVEALAQPAALVGRSLPQRVADPLGLPPGGPCHRQQFGVRLLEIFGRRLPLAPGHAVQMLREPAHRPVVGAEGSRAQARRVLDHRLRPPEQSPEHAHPLPRRCGCR
jgi:hypothetical protein